MPKRKLGAGSQVAESSTPKKSRVNGNQDSPAATSAVLDTPSKQRSILKGTPKKFGGIFNGEETPRSQRKVLFTTPSKPDEIEAPPESTSTLTTARNDRSARRKSARLLLEKTTLDDASEDDELAADDAIAREILNSTDSEEAEEDDFDALATINNIPIPDAPDTPSKRGRGRPRIHPKERKQSPTPPQDLPPHELYFHQNKPGAQKISSNTLPSHLLLTHEDYLVQIGAWQDSHQVERDWLQRLHARAFEQWVFELDQGFNICLYGYGSKRELVDNFLEQLCAESGKDRPKIIVVNGYTPSLTLPIILRTIASAIVPKNALSALPNQPEALLAALLSHLTSSTPAKKTHLVVHSIDAPRARLSQVQSALSRLASHPSVSILATADTLTFPLLWDSSTRQQFRWLFHDATTFAPFTAEMDVVEEVNGLLGRGGRRGMGGKDGVRYVLKSLTENARGLFRILVSEQLAAADSSSPAHDEEALSSEDEEMFEEVETPSKRARKAKPKPKRPKVRRTEVQEGVEYRTAYHKAVEDFVCSNEIAFRTLLKEFHDHQMVESRKDALGTERLVVPFRREELETLLEELV
ncbi:Origin recognition complex subunit 2 [Elasticomyces elasticus]|nr:Origin recognition complex subunit 2 [Elasticomyces elasticus]